MYMSIYIEEERSYNPFLRTSERSVIEAVSVGSEIEDGVSDETRAKILKEIRTMKDNYKYNL